MREWMYRGNGPRDPNDPEDCEAVTIALTMKIFEILLHNGILSEFVNVPIFSLY